VATKKAVELFAAYDLTNSFTDWISHIHIGVKSMNSQYPFLAYGTDWLAFAHFMIAIVFMGAVRNPIKNIWVIEFGLIACVSIFPFSFIAGAIREIPIYWRLIDCSFGLFGGLILWRCHSLTKQLLALQMK